MAWITHWTRWSERASSINIFDCQDTELVLKLKYMHAPHTWVENGETKIVISVRVCLGTLRKPCSLKFWILFLLKMIFFIYVFKLFWCVDIKKKNLKIKKLYFDAFLSKKHFEPPPPPQSHIYICVCVCARTRTRI